MNSKANLCNSFLWLRCLLKWVVSYSILRLRLLVWVTAVVATLWSVTEYEDLQKPQLGCTIRRLEDTDLKYMAHERFAGGLACTSLAFFHIFVLFLNMLMSYTVITGLKYFSFMRHPVHSWCVHEMGTYIKKEFIFLLPSCLSLPHKASPYSPIGCGKKRLSQPQTTIGHSSKRHVAQYSEVLAVQMGW